VTAYRFPTCSSRTPNEPFWDPGDGFVLRRLSGLPVIPGPPQKPASVDRASAPNARIWTVLATDLRSAKGVQNGGYARAATSRSATLRDEVLERPIMSSGVPGRIVCNTARINA
jgi:hypothetical protein